MPLAWPARKAVHEGELNKKLDPRDRAVIESAARDTSDRRDKNCSAGEGHFPESEKPPNALTRTMIKSVKLDEAFRGHSIDDQSKHNVMKWNDLLPTARS